MADYVTTLWLLSWVTSVSEGTGKRKPCMV